MAHTDQRAVWNKNMWGNPKLIQWDYGKEINLTLEDALMSLESLRFMLGGSIHRVKDANDVIYVHHTEEVVAYADTTNPTKILIDLPEDHLSGEKMIPTATPGHPIRFINLSDGTRTQISVTTGSKAMGANGNELMFKNPAAGLDTATAIKAGDHIRIFWEEKVDVDNTSEAAVEVSISPDTFPGTYRVVGDTFMRSEKTGKDEMFQFVIGKAKVTSDVTITLEAEGDPSTFSMTLNVLRSTNDAGETEMMKLIRYNVTKGTSSAAENDIGSLEAQGT